MHSTHRRRRGMGRWLATGATVLAVALPVAAATASASSPPSEPTDTMATADTSMAGGDTAAGDTTAGGAACANVFPMDAAPASEAPAGDTAATADTSMTASETAAADDAAAAPDTAAAETAAADDAAAAPDTGAADTATEGSAAGSATVTLVQTAETSLGTILVDGECRALYVFTQDVDGESTCFEGCATAWPPLLVEGGELPELAPDLDPSLFSVVEHPLGPMLSVGGFPLYYFASDVAPGDLLGQGVNGVWWVVAADGTMIDASGAGAAPTDSGAPAGTDAAAGTDAMATTGTEAKSTEAGY